MKCRTLPLSVTSVGDAKWRDARCGTRITPRWMDYRNSLPVSLKTCKTRASHSDSNHSLHQALIRAHFSNSEAFRWVNSSVSFSPLTTRTSSLGQSSWANYTDCHTAKQKTKTIQTNAVTPWSSSVESHLRTDNLQPAASHSSFINESNPL